MPISHAAAESGEPKPELPTPADDDREQERAAVEHHLQEMLARLQDAAQRPGSPERTAELQGVAGEYTLGLLEDMVASDGKLEAQLIRLGARTARGNWQLDSELFTFLADEMALSLPTRLKALRDGHYKSANEFNAGMSKQLRNLIGRYRPRTNVHVDRRPLPRPPSATA